MGAEGVKKGGLIIGGAGGPHVGKRQGGTTGAEPILLKPVTTKRQGARHVSP